MEGLIRDCGKRDFDVVYALICELEGKGFSKDELEKVYLANLNNDKIKYVLMEFNGEAAAFGSVHLQELLHHCGCVAEIQELVVTSKYQGRGLGKKLLQELKRWAFSRGALQLEVACNKKRTHANLFYEGAGFSKTHNKFVIYR